MLKAARRTTQRLKNLTDMEVGFTLSQAIAEASRCLLCHDAPCSRGCPAGTDPGTFIWKLRVRNVRGAIRTIRQNNPLGGVCGVACPVERLCQKNCSATGIDRPIEIGRLQRFLVEQGWGMGFDPIAQAPPRKESVAIVGSGPAGLTCAVELARAGIQATVFEARPRPGGVLRYGVPRFRLHEEFLDRELEDVRKLGVTFRCNTTIQRDQAGRLLEKGYAAVFIAPGVWEPRRLPLPGAGLRNVTTATELLAGVRAGAAAAVARMVRKKNVAIIGGGSVAMDVASTCKALSAAKVYCICLESLAEIPASKADLGMALENFVVVKPQAQVTRILGLAGKVTGVQGIETVWKRPGSFAPANARPVPGTEFKLRVDAVVFSIGSGPAAEGRELAAGLKTARDGLIQTKRDGVSTSKPGIFAGGDIVRGPALIVNAVADGKAAAKRILESLGAGENHHD